MFEPGFRENSEWVYGQLVTWAKSDASEHDLPPFDMSDHYFECCPVAKSGFDIDNTEGCYAGFDANYDDRPYQILSAHDCRTRLKFFDIRI